MKSIKKILERFGLCLLSILCSAPIFAEAPKGSYDIVRKVYEGSIGETLGSSGYVWTALMGLSFLIAAFWAVIKHDPKAFIQAFLISAVISTITTIFL